MCGASSGWCRSNAGDSDRIRGMRTKLCRGGGHEVAHSIDRPQPHGSSTSTLGAVRAVFHTLYRKTSVEAPSRNDDTDDTMFRVVKPSPDP